MEERNSSGVLRLRNANEVMGFVADYANGKRAVNGTGVDIAIIDEMTPYLAQYFLDNGLRNRKPDARHVSVLAATMKAGGFVGGLDPLRLNSKGQAIDYMHRGLAVQTSESVIKGVPLFVLADDRAMTALDTDSKARNLRNVYDIRGEKPIPNCVTSGAILELGDFKQRRVGTQARDAFLQVYDQLDVMMHLYTVNARVTGGLLAAAARCARVDRDRALSFFSSAVMRDIQFNELPPGDDHKPPEVTVLRRKLAEHVRDRVRGYQRLKNDAAAGLYCFERLYSGERSSNYSCPRDKLTKADEKMGRTKGSYKIIDFGREEFNASSMSALIDNYHAVRKSADKIVKDYLKRL